MTTVAAVAAVAAVAGAVRTCGEGSYKGKTTSVSLTCASSIPCRAGPQEKSCSCLGFMQLDDMPGASYIHNSALVNL